jgi:hypothetical protein
MQIESEKWHHRSGCARGQLGHQTRLEGWVGGGLDSFMATEISIKEEFKTTGE